MSKETYFKVLMNDGVAPFQSHFRWPLPNKDGAGQWVELDKNRPLRKCAWGLHATTKESLLYWVRYSYICLQYINIYEIEFDETWPFLTDTGSDAKPVGARARLVRKLPSRLTKDELVEFQYNFALNSLKSYRTNKYKEIINNITELVEKRELYNAQRVVHAERTGLAATWNKNKLYYFLTGIESLLSALLSNYNTYICPNLGKGELARKYSEAFANLLLARSETVNT